MKGLLNIVITAALKAGEEILKVYESADFEVEYKKDDSPLTQADKNAHEAIMSFLKKTGIPVLSEEGREIPYAERKNWKQLWIVDPLDGTKEFIKRNGEFTVNIALVEAGIPVLGVVYVPITQDLYFAERDKGSFKVNCKKKNGVDALVKAAVQLPLTVEKERFTVVASRSHLSPETEEYIKNLNKEVALISSGSSIKICLVAEGSADVYPRFAPTMEWDTAAGHAIALYAGKNIYQTDEINPVVYNKEDLLNPWFVVK